MSIKSKTAKNICVIGAGHVGLVAAACFAHLGHKVICVDNNKKRINGLKKGIMPFYEPGLEKLVINGCKKEKLSFSFSISGSVKCSDLIFIAVGTPPMPDGSVDLIAVENVVKIIANNLNDYKLIVSKSTVPVNTGKRLLKIIENNKKGKNSFDVASNPEFLREGKAIFDFFHPDRLIFGVGSQKAANLLHEVYSKIKTEKIVTDINTAEMIKYASNSFLAMKVSYINAISCLSDKLGADIKKIAHAIGADKRIGFDFLNAGIGYGGFCFPKDVQAFHYTAKKLGYDFRLLDEVQKINKNQPKLFVKRIEERLGTLKGKNFSVCGLSFKPNTSDIRFSPAIKVINLLLAKKAAVYVYDPQAIDNSKKILIGNVTYCKKPYLKSDIDCLCVLTEWAEFEKIDFKKLKKQIPGLLVADGRNTLNREKIISNGFGYIGIGR
ncbi:MAG: UDP-glucose/GDP-mannose dehydrogenase family protein [Candidatus Omnitrophica bacterium]|nr:UDP-glucose/GDP-mannose dehydrogenase family protein [Candidatus Omnitrophota bacterium]MDD5081047.1 UDP-glucose/GDP-mannose dehydrogenase family protein [Candidatus Omnitrophota bacterium]MDD5441007.1 UDP-glucose/GDP-mannose dehydrogenase family protein [Candidatus Omnitrophota bacterium]